MSSRRVAVCEKRSFLTAGLERQFAGDIEWSFRWYPYASDLFKSTDTFFYPLIIFECAELEESILKRLAELTRLTRLLAVLPRENFELECLLRELGASAVYTRLDGIEEIAHGVRKLILSSD